MKKLILSVLLVIFAFSVIGCGNQGQQGGTTVNQEQVLLEQEITAAKEALSTLALVKTYCDEMSSAIYSAWHFAIYDADDEYSYMLKYVETDNWKDYIINSFWFKTSGMSSTSLIKQAFENILGDFAGLIWADLLSNSSYSVGVAIEYNKLNGNMAEGKKYLDEAKGIINNLTEGNKQSTHKDDLVDLYATISSYYDIVERPSGSYNSYGTTISNYKTDINNKISKIEIYLV